MTKTENNMTFLSDLQKDMGPFPSNSLVFLSLTITQFCSSLRELLSDLSKNLGP